MAHLFDFIGRGVDILSFRGAGGTGRQKFAGFQIFDHADKTAGGMGNFAVETQTGDGDAFAGCHLQYGFAGLRLNGLAVKDKFKSIIFSNVAHLMTS